MKKFVVIATLLASALAHAESGPVTCTALVDGKVEKMAVKVTDAGRIEYWMPKQMAKVAKSSYWLQAFKEDTENYGWEYLRNFKAPNGYAILVAGDTGGEFSFGLSGDRSSAFFKYKDTGSGSGNKAFKLNCQSAQ